MWLDHSGLSNRRNLSSEILTLQRILSQGIQIQIQIMEIGWWSLEDYNFCILITLDFIKPCENIIHLYAIILLK